jgi:GNAT superfamily N-acetyltransferase
VEHRIRRARTVDLPALVTVKHDAGVAAWGHILPPAVIAELPFPDRWEAAIEDPDPRVQVHIVEADGEAVGFAVTRPSGDADAGPETGELDAFFVDPGHWGRGAGRALLNAAVTALRTVGFRDATLWTATENHRPRRIYETAGWRTDGAQRQRAIGGVGFVEVRYRLALPASS